MTETSRNSHTWSIPSAVYATCILRPAGAQAACSSIRKGQEKGLCSGFLFFCCQSFIINLIQETWPGTNTTSQQPVALFKEDQASPGAFSWSDLCLALSLWTSLRFLEKEGAVLLPVNRLDSTCLSLKRLWESSRRTYPFFLAYISWRQFT